MTVTTKIELRPFTVPNYVIQVVPPGRREEGLIGAPSHRLGDLDDLTLNQLCDDFRAGVMARAREQRETPK